MIEVLVDVQDGCLTRLRVDGHAPVASATGISTVCAAASGIVRSVAEVLAMHDSHSERRLGVHGAAAEAGVLEVAVTSPLSDAEWLRGVTDTLVAGIERLAYDAPQEVQVLVRKGEQHGS